MRFKKEYFEKHKPISNNDDNLEEFVGGDDMSYIDGDHTQTNDSEIQTGPIDKPFNDDSDFKKGLPTTTNKMAQYANPRNWWTLYLKGFGGRMGSMGGAVAEDTSVDDLNEEMELKAMIKELLSKWSQPTDIVNNDTNIEEIDPEIAGNTNDLITQLNSKDITQADIKKILRFITQSVKK